MAFEKFTKQGRGYTPKVSIWMRGQIGFNQGAMRVMGLTENCFAILYYDTENKRIGLEITSNGDVEGACRLTVRPTGALIGAKAFLEYYQIQYKDKTRSYGVRRDKESSLFVIDLRENEAQDN